MQGLPVPDSGSFLFAKGPRSEPVRRSLLISYNLLGLEIFRSFSSIHLDSRGMLFVEAAFVKTWQ